MKISISIVSTSIILALISLPNHLYSQAKKQVLFIGNSYTAYNNLPQLTANLALSVGDTLVFDSNTPGGTTFSSHSTNATTLAKIQDRMWDYVVLQEQSQMPSFPIGQVNAQVFPFAKKLDSLIHANNPCSKTVFYMTWGRKNGDQGNCQNYPPICTYEGMDDLLSERYLMMMEQNNAMISPVGKVWRYLRANHPEIELYQGDESHPSLAGSYAAATTFCAILFEKDPTLITENSSLSTTVAQQIRNAVKEVVFTDLNQWDRTDFTPLANFSTNVVDNQVVFSNQSENAQSYEWNFGDGTTSTLENPTHTYSSIREYTVTFIANNCDNKDTLTQTISIETLSISELISEFAVTIYPNPTKGILYITGENLALVQLHDLAGRELEIQREGNALNLEHLYPGWYQLTIQIKEQQFSKFILKE